MTAAGRRGAGEGALVRAIAGLAILAGAAALAGCAGGTARPSASLAEMMPRFQVACSARGLRPGGEAFEACVRKEVAVWRGTEDRGEASAKAEGGAVAKAGNCRLSPLGGYDCGPRSRP